ncbi:MAG: hypothetical protein LIO80_00215 [Lachnospiraceae bacterium]|nr:hypothetical protein [Lachnospiraceae bacterium]
MPGEIRKYALRFVQTEISPVKICVRIKKSFQSGNGFFQNILRQYSFSEPKILNDHQVESVAAFGDFYVVALANLEYAEDRQNQRMTVRPRQG